MRAAIRLVVSMALALSTALLCPAQSLTPRAYVITPVDSNALTVTENLYTGGVQFNNTIPITDASGTVNLIVPTIYHSLSFFGRSANFTVGVPYAVGSFSALIIDQKQSTYRSGLGDGIFRFSVNLKGGPAMKVPEFRKWKQKTLLGVSLLVQFPSGQYDPTKLINIGDNKWAFKPEFGYSHSFGNWLIDAYSAVWFFTNNPEFFSHNQFFPGTNDQSQEPVLAFEGHLSRNFKPRLWASLDGNFWVGGKTSINGVQNESSLQRNSRVGVTVSVPVSKHQSLKFAYADGAYVRYGGDFQAISVAWQYSWIGTKWR